MPLVDPGKVCIVELGRGGLGDCALALDDWLKVVTLTVFDLDERGIPLCPRESEATVMAFCGRKSARRECVLS